MKTPKRRTQGVWVYVLVAMVAVAVCSVWTPTLALALYAQRYLVEGLSLGAVKG